MIGTSPALDSLSSISPSFTTQSSDNSNLSDIAARVVAELQNDIQNDDIYDQFYVTQKEEEDPEEEKEFEFAVVRTSPSVTADVTTPLRYPLFDRSLLLDDNHDHDHDESMTSSVVVRRPLRMLFNEERETTTSCSSSESDDLEGVTPGTYCVWKPKDSSSEPSPDLRKKSNSTGNSSKRWKTFKKLLSRSNSHDGNFGKNDVLSNSMGGKKNGSDQKVFVKKVENTAKVAGADDEGDQPRVMVSVSDDNKKSSNRFKSYLSYKQIV